MYSLRRFIRLSTLGTLKVCVDSTSRRAEAPSGSRESTDTGISGSMPRISATSASRMASSPALPMP